jgi:hypothetical protein
MKHFNIFSAAIFAVLFSAQIYSQTERWIWFCEDRGYNMYYDSSAIENITDYTIVWVKSVSDKELYISGERIEYMLSYCQMFCSERKLHLLARYMFSANRLTSPIKLPIGKDEYNISSGSSAEALYNKICNK